jgi:hypothetical protein
VTESSDTSDPVVDVICIVVVERTAVVAIAAVDPPGTDRPQAAIKTEQPTISHGRRRCISGRVFLRRHP